MRALLPLVLAATGCDYAVYDVEGPMPPDVTRAAPEPGVPIALGPDGQSFFVLARGYDEPFSVTFTWTLDGEVLGTAYPIDDGNGSQVDLPADLAEGGELACVVSDGYADTVLTWPIVVPE